MIEASDRAAAVRTLIGRGIAPRSIELTSGGTAAGKSALAKVVGKSGAEGLPASVSRAADLVDTEGSPPATMLPDLGVLRRRGMSLQDTSSFINELATAVQAGLPIVPALRTLMRTRKPGVQRNMLRHLISEVESGRTLNSAFASWGKPFDEMIISLTKAGEVSGKLAEVLSQAAELLERDLKLRRSVLSATLYPLILLSFAGLAVAIIATFIVPKILEPLKGQNVQLPLPTLLVQGFADFMATWWWLLILLGGAMVMLFGHLRRSPGPRLAMDEFVLKVPLIGNVLRDAAVARFTRTLGTLVSSGLPVLSALRLTGETLTNEALRQGVRKVCEEVAGGKTIAEPLDNTGLFPPLLVQIVSLGERSGKLAELLRNAAGSLELRTESRIKVLTTVLPPILVVIVACVVGVVVAAILLPLLDLQDAAGRM